MPERHCRPHIHDSRRRLDSSDSPFPASAGISPAAAARPAAMARLILRRVGITPLLSLLAAPLLGLLPIETAEAQPTATPAQARVVILPQAVRLQQGMVGVSGPSDGQSAMLARLSQPQHRACSAQDAAPTGHVAPNCRLIITDMP